MKADQERVKGSAIVTGGARGIGAAIVDRLLEEGVPTAVLDLEVPNGQGTKIHRTRSQGIVCDLNDLQAIEESVHQAQKELGTISILINNAGWGGPFHRLTQVSEEEWDRIFNVNLKSVFRLTKLLIPKMQSQGYGRIINIASVQGLLGSALSTTYAASKHALIGYTRSLAAEWGRYGITCNAICPGYIETKMSAQAPVSDYRERIQRRTPCRRLGQPQEIAGLTAYLLRQEAAFINGAVLPVDGGLSADLGILSDPDSGPF